MAKLRVNKYKEFLVLFKYFPFIIIITEILYSLFSYFDIDISFISVIAGVSVLTMLFLYIGSYVFQFCYLYRISLHSIVGVNIIALYDTYVEIPISDLNILRIYLIILLIGLISFIKFKVKDAKHNKKSTS